MDMLSEIVQMDDEGRLFLSAVIEDWKPILDLGIETVIDLEGGIDHGVPTTANQFLYVYLPIQDDEAGPILTGCTPSQSWRRSWMRAETACWRTAAWGSIARRF